VQIIDLSDDNSVSMRDSQSNYNLHISLASPSNDTSMAGLSMASVSFNDDGLNMDTSSQGSQTEVVALDSRKKTQKVPLLSSNLAEIEEVEELQ